MHDVLLIFLSYTLILSLLYFLYVAVTEYRFLIILRANIAWLCVEFVWAFSFNFADGIIKRYER